jgi:RNA polymerase sigma-70 factor, ECF subfamily
MRGSGSRLLAFSFGFCNFRRYFDHLPYTTRKTPTLTFAPFPSSIPWEYPMGIMGLALPWEHRIASAPCERERRVEPFRDPVPASSETAEAQRAEDTALAAGCRSGDLHAYERLYNLHGSRMKNLARNLLSNTLDAEDAVQETFLKIQRSIGSFRGESTFVSWTFRILVNTCHDVRRSRLRKKEIASDTGEQAPPPEPRAPGAHPTLRLALERALANLTSHQRDVFLLYEVEGFRHAEIAEMLDLTETASKNTLFQAKKNLRRMLDAPRGADTAGAR